MSIQHSDETTTTTPAISLAFSGGRQTIDDCDRAEFAGILRDALLNSPRALEFFEFRGIDALQLTIPMEYSAGPYVTAIELEQPVRRSQGISL